MTLVNSLKSIYMWIKFKTCLAMTELFVIPQFIHSMLSAKEAAIAHSKVMRLLFWLLVDLMKSCLLSTAISLVDHASIHPALHFYNNPESFLPGDLLPPAARSNCCFNQQHQESVVSEPAFWKTLFMSNLEIEMRADARYGRKAMYSNIILILLQGD